MKKFRKNTEGFTLVELIVVIAILGILACVGTVGYSGYVKKANMAADQQLVSQVANALTLHHYANSATPEIDYVLLTNSGARADGYAADAMEAAFGDGWETSCVLKHDGWTNTETAKTVVNSTYLTKRSADDLLDSVSILTDIVASAVGDGKVEDTLATLGIVGDDFKDKLSAYTPGTDAYKNAVGNMLVFHVAEEISKPDFDPSSAPHVVLWAYQYAYVYAYSAANDPDALTSLNADLKEAAKAGSASEIAKALDQQVFFKAMTPEVEAFISSNQDMQAFNEIMKAAADLSENILASGDAGSSGMWGTEGVQNTVDGYFDAMEAVSALNPGEAGVIVMVDRAGGVEITPELS